MSRRRSGGRLAASLASAAVALTVESMLERGRSDSERWHRRNYRGRDVDLFGGPAAAAGAAVAATTAAIRGRPGGLVVCAAAASLGLYDDLYGDRHARGLRGHIRELAAGRVTTGLVKMAGLTAAGAAAAATERAPWADVVVDAALVAGAGNLLNLLDLRPGRALKVAALSGALLSAGHGSASVTAAGTLGVAAALLPADLGERRMIGDCGANTLGALLGWTVAARGSRAGRVAALGLVVGLTLASERVSFSAVIDRTPVLAAVDGWGRRAA